MNYIDAPDRFYTFTLKPTLKSYKGNMTKLNEAFSEVLGILGAQVEHKVYEKVGTDQLHLHALLECPYIPNKMILKKYLLGYHTHLEIVRHGKDVEQIWKLYTAKERSDAEQYTEAYGNMFPLADLA